MAVINQPNFFPASREITRYLPNVLLMNNIQLQVAGLVWLYPIFIKKYVENPTFCMEVTTYSNVVDAPIVSAGIYEGVDIFGSGALLFSTDFTLINAGIKKNSSILKLRPGWHTIASTIKVVQTSGSVFYRSVLQNLSNPLFGTAPNAAFFHTLYGAVGVNSASLPANLSGQTIVKLSGAGILVALEY